MTDMAEQPTKAPEFDPPARCPNCGSITFQIHEHWELFADLEISVPGLSHGCPVTVRAGRVGTVNAQGAVEWSGVRIERIVASDDEIETQEPSGIGADLAGHDLLSMSTELRCTGCGASRQSSASPSDGS